MLRHYLDPGTMKAKIARCVGVSRRTIYITCGPTAKWLAYSILARLQLTTEDRIMTKRVGKKPHSQIQSANDVRPGRPAGGGPVVEVQDLRKNYGNTVAVSIDHIAVHTGDCVGVVGNNGAGKTTFLRLVLDLVAADRGRVQVCGEPVHRSQAWKTAVGSYLDEAFLPTFLTPREFLHFVGGFYALQRSHVDKLLSGHLELVDESILMGQGYIRGLSHGTRKKIGLISALMFSTSLLVLDEPFSGLDPTSQLVLADKLRAKVAQGTAVLLSSHDLVGVTELCNRILLLDKGRPLRCETTSPETLSELRSYFTSQQTVVEKTQDR